MTIAKVVRKTSLDKQGQEAKHWRTQPYQARLAVLEEIRREYHQVHYGAEPRLQRVYTIVKQ